MEDPRKSGVLAFYASLYGEYVRDSWELNFAIDLMLKSETTTSTDELASAAEWLFQCEWDSDTEYWFKEVYPPGSQPNDPSHG